MTVKDVIRPISGFFFIQPFVIVWLMITEPNPAQSYIEKGWLFQIYLTLLFIPYYAWFERVWKDPIQSNINDIEN